MANQQLPPRDIMPERARCIISSGGSDPSGGKGGATTGRGPRGKRFDGTERKVFDAREPAIGLGLCCRTEGVGLPEQKALNK